LNPNSGESAKRQDYAGKIEKWIGKIKEKDLEHLTTAKKFELKDNRL
jgi:hypothetical protein